MRDRFIVELSGESAAQSIARTFPPAERRAALLGDAGRQARALVRLQQAPVRGRLERRGAQVIGSLDTLGNILIVRMPHARAARLRRVPGVLRVVPERTYHLTLDHALPLHKVPEAWSLGGVYSQGAGVKIGMIDTGIDITHPGFNDAGFQAPAGFPIVTADSDKAYTNQKVSVARSYVGPCLASDPDTSARDDSGHGTGTAMAAAGVQNTGPLATITGVAPLAYLGNYKVFGSPGVNDDTNDCAIVQAIEDAVNDGMDVINLSLGSVPAPRIIDDNEVQVLETAISMGVIVVIAAGNNGPDPNTIGSPGTTPSAITAGAMNNNRIFADSFMVGSNSFAAIPGDESLPTSPITAPLVDISLQLDNTGLGCGTLPANSLKGSIALILRGTCLFQDKLNNAQKAGAVAALIYTYASSPAAITMSVGNATLPAEMVSNQDGLAIKQLATSPAQATMSFTQAPFSVDPNSIAGFSSRGPSVDASVKPDILTVGENVYTATETLDPLGELYNPSGYVLSQGTSYSAPLMAGAAATLKAARPGLTPYEYKSLLVNNAAAAFPSPSQAQSVQSAGAGYLDLSAAMLSTLAVNPASITFGIGSGGNPVSLRLSNIGYDSDTFQISVSPAGNSPAPVLSATSVQLDSDTYFDLSLSFPVSGLAAGEYEGFLTIQGTHSGTVIRVPYWYGVASNKPAHITVLYVPAVTAAGSVANVLFRITDASGIIVSGVTPTVTVTSGGGSVSSVGSEDASLPGVWSMDVRLDRTSGASNIFQIAAGGITQTVTIISQ